MRDSIHEGGELDEIDDALIALLRGATSGRSARDLLSGLAERGHQISQPTLSRRLAKLQEARHVVARKAGRNTVYERDPYHDWFSLPPTRRPSVAYDFGVLASYEPNQTQWVSPRDRDRLNRAGGGRQLDASTYSQAIAQKLMVDLAYASSALEGNTYTYLDTQVLIEFNQAATGKASEETQMILNHKDAISYLVDNIADIEISPQEMRTLHALLSRGLLELEAVGTIRRRPVDITGSAYVPMAIPQQLESELNALTTTAREIDDPFEQSLFLMAMISYLQAFTDVNKRTGRLACNIPLLKSGLAPLSFMEMDKSKYVQGMLAFYELHRIELLREAYVECYLSSAKRYDAYVGRGRADIELERRYRGEIQTCIQGYVKASVGAGRRLDAGRFARQQLSQIPKDVQPKLIQRLGMIIDSLNDATHVAYAIPRPLFHQYEALEPRVPADEPDPGP